MTVLLSEYDLFSSGALTCAGADEVGRGPYCGPLVVGFCAVTPTQMEAHPAVADSKQLSEKRREALYAEILDWAPVGVGWVSNVEIDEVGMAASLRLGAQRALADLAQLGVLPDAVIQDGSSSWLPSSFTAGLAPGRVVVQPRADQHCVSVSAASIVIKVLRDREMERLDALYPNWGLARHKGYGTAEHEEALRKFGLSPLHRSSWSYVQRLGLRP